MFLTEEFSARTRAANLDRLREGTADLLVIGGGIVGAGVSREAARRGLRTGLLERGDFASGTSGKTSRLIHGGLRYLQDYRIGLVRQALRERDRLLENAPALVHPLPFLIPAYSGRRPRAMALRFGLFLYDLLSGKKLPRRVWLRPEAAVEREPGLIGENLAGAGVYHDAWTDDARFVLAVVQDAGRARAAVANYVEVTGLIRHGERVAGVQMVDRMGGGSAELRAKVVVNATGVRLDSLREPRPIPTIRPTKGIHIFLPRAKVGNRHALALTTKRDGRIVFVLPWGDLTLVGTTDTDFHGDPDRVVPDGRDVSYLLEATNEAFPGAKVGLEDVVSAYAGLRPLVRRGTNGSSESEISRAHEIFLDSDGLISIAGGKFTTHRAMGEEVVDLVETRLARRSRSATRHAPLGPTIRPLEEFLALGIEESSALHLQGRYSAAQVSRFLDARAGRSRIVDGRPNLWAEVDIAIREEMALTLSDVLVRRLGLFYEAADQALAVAPDVANRMAGMLDWDSTRTANEVAAYRDLVSSHRAFREDASRSP